MSPMAGTVDAMLETVFRDGRNGVLAVAVVAAGVLAGAALELLLLVLLELPHPASMSATPARARIDDLGTGLFSCRWGVGTRHRAIRAACLTPLDSAGAGLLPGPVSPRPGAAAAPAPASARAAPRPRDRRRSPALASPRAGAGPPAACASPAR